MPQNFQAAQYRSSFCPRHNQNRELHEFTCYKGKRLFLHSKNFTFEVAWH